LLQHPTSVATKVVCLTQVVREEELKDDLEYEDIVEDMKQEGEKFGKSSVIVTFILLSLLINPQSVLWY
jgi:splicing factor U2AF subunit